MACSIHSCCYYCSFTNKGKDRSVNIRNAGFYVYWLVFTTKDDLNVKDVTQIDATAIAGALIFSRSLNPAEHI